ncbi:MAG TPA: O-antigen ligase family protein [Puia sp.]|nr:O-antigen ligase family protein [Puia sp.]
METTLLAWFNINAQLIIGLLFFRLMEGNPLRNIKTAFSNTFFLSCFLLCLVKCAGLLYAQDVNFGWYLLQKRATLVAIPFIFCCAPFTDKQGRRKIMTAFCVLLLITSVYCLIVNAWQWVDQRNSTIFFYHALVTPISQNAIFYSAFLCFGLLFLLSDDLYGLDNKPRLRKQFRIFMILFFVGFIVLLSSKLMLAIALLILAAFLGKKESFKKNRKLVIGTGLLCLLIVIVVMMTKNPIRERWLDAVSGPIKKENISPGTSFNGVQLRILQWQFAYEILNENHAWFLGVSPGDTQHKLDQKYIHANMYLGNPALHDTGFLNYNFHNQYIEELVQSGIVGLLLLLFSCWALVQLAIRVGSREAGFTVFILLALFFTESSLQMQDGLFLYTFFPCMLLFDTERRAI